MIAPFFLMIVILVLFLAPALLQWLWNITMPDLFDLPRIEYWHAFRLLLIAGLLFGGPAATVGG